MRRCKSTHGNFYVHTHAANTETPCLFFAFLAIGFAFQFVALALQSLLQPHLLLLCQPKFERKKKEKIRKKFEKEFRGVCVACAIVRVLRGVVI